MNCKVDQLKLGNELQLTIIKLQIIKTLTIQLNSFEPFKIYLSRCSSPPGGVLSLVPLRFPWWFYVVFDGLLGVLIVLCSFDEEVFLGVMPMNNVNL